MTSNTGRIELSNSALAFRRIPHPSAPIPLRDAGPSPAIAHQPPSPHHPLRSSSRRLWTAVSNTALSAHGVRLPALSLQARDREAPYSRLSPQERRRLWTAGRITALSAHGVRLPALLRSSPISLPTSPPPDPTRRHQHTNPTSGLTAILHAGTLPKPPVSNRRLCRDPSALAAIITLFAQLRP